jgi:ubiquinone/menaquinone biosynthesis C-methylase UbiE
LDDSTRRTWFSPEVILKSVGLRSGMVFADVGCGSGFFSLLAATMVGHSGLVYAVDSSAAAIERLKRKAGEQELENIRAVVSRGEETRFCRRCVDIVFYSMVLHDFDDPEKVLLNAKHMLKPHGKLVNLDWKKKQLDFGPPEHIRFSEDTASCLLRHAGFTIESARDAGRYHYIIIARVIGARARNPMGRSELVRRSHNL